MMRLLVVAACASAASLPAPKSDFYLEGPLGHEDNFTYLNTATLGPSPKQVVEALTAAAVANEKNPNVDVYEYVRDASPPPCLTGTAQVLQDRGGARQAQGRRVPGLRRGRAPADAVDDVRAQRRRRRPRRVRLRVRRGPRPDDGPGALRRGERLALPRERDGRHRRQRGDPGRKRVIRRHFNVGVPEAISKRQASTL